jgi:serine/threonine protein kinase/Tfp pilus assembly protein PilF
LVRLDLEYSWRRGRPRRLEELQGPFPELFRDRDCLQEIAFEEYRLRLQLGDGPTPEEYRQRWDVRTDGWPAPPNLLAEAVRRLPVTVKAPAGRPPEPASTSAPLPEVGTEFLDFRLLAELGRGAFGRVYLARQQGLAGRLVALKIASNISLEARSLAQLQHTNIVPVYSVHQAGPLHALCMPYLGPTTLADVLADLRGRQALPSSGKGLVDTAHACKSTTRQEVAGRGPAPEGQEASRSGPEVAPVAWQQLEHLTYVQAVVWIGARLAEGLAHAHERGILHRDLKPANVLLTDDGQPMLLDFNLAEDTKDSGAAAFLGGTLPYMAPEHVRALQRRGGTVDGRSDVYSLGVILHELLTGRHPFPRRAGPLEGAVAQMLHDRDQPPPRLRRWNRAVSPAVEAIVRHCLQPDPARRYQSARELHEDLQRQIDSRPLRYAREPLSRERAGKWARRHPRLALAGVAGMALLLIAGLTALLAVRGARQARWEAAESYQKFREDVREARLLLATTKPSDRERLAEGVGRALAALDSYRARTDPTWWQAPAVRRLPAEDQDRLRAEAGELLLLLASIHSLPTQAGRAEGLESALELNRLAERCYPEGKVPALVWRQRASLARRLGRPASVGPPPAGSPPGLCVLAQEQTDQGHFAEALPLWRQAARQAPDDLWAWAGLAACCERLGRHAEAASCYSTCIALAPTLPWLYFKRGTTHLSLKNFADAQADFDHFLRERPGVAEAHINRALAWEGLGKNERALDNITRAIDLHTTQTRAYFIRALLRDRVGDRAGAEQDRATGLRLEPTDELSWVVRGLARARADAQGALADFDRALRLEPRSLDALQNKANVLSEHLARPFEAVRVLHTTIELYPHFVPARAGRGVLLARLGKRREALRDAEECLRLDSQPATLYQVAGIYALTSRQEPDDRQEALFLLASALRRGYGWGLIAIDTDLDPIRCDPEFERLTARGNGPAKGP